MSIFNVKPNHTCHGETYFVRRQAKLKVLSTTSPLLTLRIPCLRQKEESTHSGAKPPNHITCRLSFNVFNLRDCDLDLITPLATPNSILLSSIARNSTRKFMPSLCPQTCQTPWHVEHQDHQFPAGVPTCRNDFLSTGVAFINHHDLKSWSLSLSASDESRMTKNDQQKIQGKCYCFCNIRRLVSWMPIQFDTA